jgi:phosphoribosylaminoimidazole-succinocarboxamide synthase
LTSNNLKGKEGVEMPEQIAKKTTEKYIEAYELLTGKKWNP